MQLLTEDKCPVCDSDELAPLFTCEDRLTHLGSFDVCECKRCGFRLTNPYPTEQDIGAFYASEDYVPVSNTTRGLINKAYHLARRIMLRSKLGWVRQAAGRKTGRLLDIGSGTGEFAHAMHSAGWQTQCVEPHAGARQSSIERFGLSVCDPSEQAALADASYDVITMWHVLEHVHDVNRSFRELDRLLAPGGGILIAIPNFSCLDAGFYGVRWAAYDTPRHLHHFSPPVMRRLAEKHGFEVTRQRAMLFDPIYIPLLTERERADRNWLRGGVIAALSWLFSLLDPARCTAITYELRRRV